eukprot:2604331-Amphidinium_carterae.1
MEEPDQRRPVSMGNTGTTPEWRQTVLIDPVERTVQMTSTVGRQGSVRAARLLLHCCQCDRRIPILTKQRLAAVAHPMPLWLM